jgi:hypothetical protein
VLLTVTDTAALVVVLPAASRATAVSVCAPLVAVVLFQLMLYGAKVSSQIHPIQLKLHTRDTDIISSISTDCNR